MASSFNSELLDDKPPLVSLYFFYLIKLVVAHTLLS